MVNPVSRGRGMRAVCGRILAPSAQRARNAMVYLLVKSIHLLFVMAWVASVFYLPRTLVNLAEATEAGEPDAVRARLLLMGRRLYKFGHMMFGFAFLAGLVLWLGYRVLPAHFPNVVGGMGWLHAKLG